MKIFRKIADFSYFKNTKKRVGLAMFILIVALIIFTGYFLFFYEKQCENAECFIDAMKTCKAISWIRSDDQASWLYITKWSFIGDNCEVEVKLLEIKQGTIESEKLAGKEMTCTLPKEDISFPEKDISRCTGLLKEEMQDLIIKRMHDYLLKNVGEVSQEFGWI